MGSVSVNADRYASLEYQAIYLRNEWGDVLFPDLRPNGAQAGAEAEPLKPDELIGALDIAIVDCLYGNPLPRLMLVDCLRRGGIRGQHMTKLRDDFFEVRNCLHYYLLTFRTVLLT